MYEHMIELMIIFSNLTVVIASVALAIVTGADNRAMARIAAMALLMLTKRSPERLRKLAGKGKDNSAS